MIGSTHGPRGRFGCGLAARMHDGERTRGIDRLADGCKVGETDGMVDRILRTRATAAQRDDGHADIARGDLLHDAGALRMNGLDHGCGPQVLSMIVQDIGRAAERGDHALEDLRRLARGYRLLNLRTRLFDTGSK